MFCPGRPVTAASAKIRGPRARPRDLPTFYYKEPFLAASSSVGLRFLRRNPCYWKREAIPVAAYRAVNGEKPVGQLLLGSARASLFACTNAVHSQSRLSGDYCEHV